jgi:hypothetical protein
MLFGIEYLMGQPCTDKHACKQLGQFNRRCAHQHGLAAAMTLPNILYGSFVFLFRGFVNPIELVVSLTNFIGRNNDSL